MSIEEMIGEILHKEGGYVDHPVDRGGPTNLGITQATLSRYLERAATVQEVKDLDSETAKHIYELHYYRSPRIDRLPTEIQPFVFDSAVNHGPRRAIMFVQKICNDAGFGILVVDGLIGPKTKAAVDRCYEAMQQWMLLALVEERRQFYLSIVEVDPEQEVFLQGWINRVNSFIQSVA